MNHPPLPPPKPELTNHKDLIKAGKADFKSTAKQMDKAIADIRTQRPILETLREKYYAPDSTQEDTDRWLEARKKLQAAKDKAATTIDSLQFVVHKHAGQSPTTVAKALGMKAAKDLRT